jgi:hypothetical protein
LVKQFLFWVKNKNMKNYISIIILILLPLFSFAQDLTINEYGNGKTCQEARYDALRNAVNNASGSIIYAKTEISNNELISDDITMLTSGNVLNYETIKDCEEKNGTVSVFLKVTVSQTKLKKFIEGKGKSISISGELLKQKSDQEVASKNAEISIIENILLQLESFTIDPYDYEISIGQITIKDGKYCSLPADITIKTNINFYNAYLKLVKDIERISINLTDQNFRRETLKETNFPITINSKTYYLRTNKSIDLINKFYKKIILKMDNYTVVDDCLKELYLQENNNRIKLNYSLFFPNQDYIAKTISGTFTATIEEVGSLNRINIFASHKLLAYKNGSTLSGELTLMKYSETNPLEFESLKNNLIKNFEELAREKEDGKIKLNYAISFLNNGQNKSTIENLKVSERNYQQIIETSINQIKLNPSKLCGNFNITTDEIKLDFKWETYKSNFAYENGKESIYTSYFNDKNLPYGSYILTVKEKELNNSKFKDIYISNFKTRGPITAIYSAIFPGWGTRRVTYHEKKGWNRFALVVAPLALSIVSKAISNSYYYKYLNASEQTKIDDNFSSANYLNKSSMLLAGVSATFYIYDFVWVFGKGLSNISKKHKIKDRIKTSEFQIQTQTLK